ncbi:acyl-CoA carboxylase subunit epsilon [Sphaerisporangium sp. TRM90804]|uniref:acyl-CoA carboxylase subunit epsilon n=1 Tax=Sphaerisporangium sp. TRM90804 TaxID=3031113 RepID=UPI002448617C|nr:acyl-CoA carboxylase subunit epsilon [Sphaerisporangium sp. TRM90804]MDH2430514.1 acyl-CoA carboxylase subunit epsilon [Sphaerisporangium sp. TRM90804]
MSEGQVPVIRVLRGDPDAYELAALTVALLITAAPPAGDAGTAPRRAVPWRLPPGYRAPGGWTSV